jgi:hypothetical protein
MQAQTVSQQGFVIAAHPSASTASPARITDRPTNNVCLRRKLSFPQNRWKIR